MEKWYKAGSIDQSEREPLQTFLSSIARYTPQENGGRKWSRDMMQDRWDGKNLMSTRKVLFELIQVEIVSF